jgi:hypothetical protein
MFRFTIGLTGVQLGKLFTENHDGINVQHEWLGNVTLLCLGHNKVIPGSTFLLKKLIAP